MKILVKAQVSSLVPGCDPYNSGCSGRYARSTCQVTYDGTGRGR